MAYDAAEADGELYLAMELIDGQSLHQFVRQNGPLPVALGVHMLLQTAQALKYSYEKGMVHRDIKPANIMIPDQGLLDFTGTNDEEVALVKVVDFGLVRSLGQDGMPSASISRLDGFVGTPDYVAPEQAQNANDVDIRADLYSLGCTFYYALTGQKPFNGNSAMEVIVQRHTKLAEPIEKLRPEVSPAIAAILRRLMEKDREHRFSNPHEVIDEINIVLGRRSSTKLPVLFPNMLKPFSGLLARPASLRVQTGSARAEEDYSRTAHSPAEFDAIEIVPKTVVTKQNEHGATLNGKSAPQDDQTAAGSSATISFDAMDGLPVLDAKASQDLPEFWQTWLNVLECIIAKKAVPISVGTYPAFHRRLLRGVHARAASSEPTQREHLRILEGLIAPWLNIQVLSETDRDTLRSLLQRCEATGNAVGLRPRAKPWPMWVFVLILLVNLAPFVWSLAQARGDVSIRHRLTWAYLIHHIEAHPYLSLALFIPTIVLIVYGLYRRFLRQ